MSRVPVVASIVVALAVATMVALGLWQLLIRLPEKEAELAQLGANPGRPVIAFPATAGDRFLFREARADCRPPIALSRAGAGNAGFRLIADCAGGVKVQLGTTRDPRGTTDWAGGAVRGRISHAPDPRPLIARVFDHSPTPLILIADTPAPGLARSAQPDIAIVPNNHLAYAVQWFVFAGIAAMIYLLALRRRSRA